MSPEDRSAAIRWAQSWGYGSMSASAYYEDFTDESLQELLDMAVHDMKGREAANINNEGVVSQLGYLNS